VASLVSGAILCIVVTGLIMHFTIAGTVLSGTLLP
jgi:hypothetical protein